MVFQTILSLLIAGSAAKAPAEGTGDDVEHQPKRRRMAPVKATGKRRKRAKSKKPTKAEVEELLRVEQHRIRAILEELSKKAGVLRVRFVWPDGRMVDAVLNLIDYKKVPASALVDAAEDQLSLRGKLDYLTQWQHQTLSGLLQTAKNGILILKVETIQ